MSAPLLASVAVIVLAGGRSSRMGAHKLLLPLGDAPVIVQSMRTALASGLRPVVVVLGHEAERVRAALDGLDVTLAMNPAYHEGIATSLRVGLAVLGPLISGAVITLADQPLIPAAHLAALVTHARATGAAIVATRFADHDGNPLFLDRAVFAEAALLRGDQGARVLLAAGVRSIAYVHLESADAALDVDAPADYARVLRLWQARAGNAGDAGH